MVVGLRFHAISRQGSKVWSHLKLQIHMGLYYFSPVLFAASEPGLAFSGDPAFSPVLKLAAKLTVVTVTHFITQKR